MKTCNYVVRVCVSVDVGSVFCCVGKMTRLTFLSSECRDFRWSRVVVEKCLSLPTNQHHHHHLMNTIASSFTLVFLELVTEEKIGKEIDRSNVINISEIVAKFSLTKASHHTSAASSTTKDMFSYFSFLSFTRFSLIFHLTAHIKTSLFSTTHKQRQ